MTGLYTRIASGLLFPMHEWAKGHRSVAMRRELERSQWWSRERLEAHQVERLRGFLQQIGRSVPYYRDLFARERFVADELASVADLSRLPFLTKALIRAHSEALKASGAGPLSSYNTGGSSGEPLIFYMDKAPQES